MLLLNFVGKSLLAPVIDIRDSAFESRDQIFDAIYKLLRTVRICSCCLHLLMVSGPPLQSDEQGKMIHHKVALYRNDSPKSRVQTAYFFGLYRAA